jgi:hypothetical protein
MVNSLSRAFGGASIVLGLLTYGYQVMRNLGNRLTLMSPSRGFCMELGSAITVLMATRLALPVSTVCLVRLYRVLLIYIDSMHRWCDSWRWLSEWRLALY